MTKAAYQPCRVQRCPNYRTNGGYCAAHQDRVQSFGGFVDQRAVYATAPNNRLFRRLRDAFLRRNPLCVRCGEPAVVLDHITPHKNDLAKFWAEANWQSLCTRCHNSKTMAETFRGTVRQ